MSFKNKGVLFTGGKISYYAKSLIRQLIPTVLYKRQLQKKLTLINTFNKACILQRVNYYNRLHSFETLTDGMLLKDIPVFKTPKTYNFDLFEYARYFNSLLKIKYLAGDVNHIEPQPTIQKSRSLTITPNDNAILLKLDKKRHFVFVDDLIPFKEKKNMLIGRGAVTQPHRIKFMEQYFGHPMCDLGQVNNKGGNLKWLRSKVPVKEHLKYKFILSLEGNDVATNLKWIMSSNSIAVMPKPKYETWFMEGSLIPDHHYIAIKDDYSDLEEKLTFYINNQHKAQEIIANANRYITQFLDSEQEDVISLLVLQKYFYYTSQIKEYALL